MGFAAKWLSPAGRLAVILPWGMEHTATSAARQHDLWVARCCYVKGRVGGEVKRVLLEFVKEATPVEQTTLAIETAPLQYTDEYCALTKDFYLKG
jgi:tRNA1Val (adenine37-N6)-methyltransferase